MKLDIKSYDLHDIPISFVWVRRKDSVVPKLELDGLYAILQTVVRTINKELIYFTHTMDLEIVGYVLTRNSNLYAIYRAKNGLDFHMYCGEVQLKRDAPIISQIDLTAIKDIMRLPYKVSILMAKQVEFRKSIQMLISTYNRISVPAMAVAGMVIINNT